MKYQTAKSVAYIALFPKERIQKTYLSFEYVSAYYLLPGVSAWVTKEAGV